MCLEIPLILKLKVVQISYEFPDPNLVYIFSRVSGNKGLMGNILVLFKPPALAGIGSDDSLAGLVLR
jgi:hypothetical protein